jgi:hypothetical protein
MQPYIICSNNLLNIQNRAIGFGTRRALQLQRCPNVPSDLGNPGEVDSGFDNPTSYYDYHETRKGGQGPVWVVAPLIIIIHNIIMLQIIVFQNLNGIQRPKF